jgi:hypothetical protein
VHLHCPSLQVEDAVVMFDHENRRPRGFGFITFSEEEAVEAVFGRGTIQTIHDKQIEIKRAVPRDSMPPSPRTLGQQGQGLGPLQRRRRRCWCRSTMCLCSCSARRESSSTLEST